MKMDLRLTETRVIIKLFVCSHPKLAIVSSAECSSSYNKCHWD